MGEFNSPRSHGGVQTVGRQYRQNRIELYMWGGQCAEQTTTQRLTDAAAYEAGKHSRATTSRRRTERETCIKQVTGVYYGCRARKRMHICVYTIGWIIRQALVELYLAARPNKAIHSKMGGFSSFYQFNGIKSGKTAKNYATKISHTFDYTGNPTIISIKFATSESSVHKYHFIIIPNIK